MIEKDKAGKPKEKHRRKADDFDDMIRQSLARHLVPPKRPKPTKKTPKGASKQ